ncbi:hypothetical protein ACH4T9_24325 [Micromonospora sp. NPDC020750]|uniref:hypothetical protein n=1 Tax=unclassified Micromonospora TaxID=2617518 RepID=UPI0037B04789
MHGHKDRRETSPRIRADRSSPNSTDTSATLRAPLTMSRLQALQRSYGNSAVNSLLAASAVQRTDPPVPLPAAASASAATEPVVIGHVYTVRGEIAGAAVVYTGSTKRELAQRLYKDRHTWSELIKNKSTTIEVHEIKAVLNVKESNGQSLRSAENEATRAAEQVVIKRRRTDVGGAVEKNARNAATEENVEVWAERHQVRLGPRTTFRAGVKIGAVAFFQLVDFFLMYRDTKLSQYAMAPYLLADETGVFTLQETDRGVFRPNWYWKNYQTGPLAGQRVQITKDEFHELKGVAERLWGTTDWKGDFIPGLLRQELPVIEDAGESADWA